MNRLSRALFFRTGLRGHVRHEIEREQLREQKAAAKLEQQLRQLRESSTATEEKLRQLTRRYDDLVQKYEATTELLAQQRERFAHLKDEVQALEKARLDERATALERARQDDHAEQLSVLMAELEGRFPIPSLIAHVQKAIERSPLMDDPYPHVVLEEVLPEALHTLLNEARPPQGFWRAGQPSRENWTIGEDLGPLRTEAAWRFMDDVVVSRALIPPVTSLFDDYLRSQTRRKAKRSGDEPRGMAYVRSGGRLMLRRPGYHFEPHLDPHRALLTGLFYFGRPEDGHDHGTKLLRSNRPIPDDHRGIYYPLREGASCELVKVVPARPNSMLVFASRIGLHGADIPADAQPSTLERYAYQFYVEAWSSSSNQRPDLDGG
jgi:hypothetical protein